MKRILAERSVLGAFGATVASIGLLVAWTKELRPGWLIAAALAHIVASILLVRGLRRLRREESARLAAALALVLMALGVATVFTWRFERLEREWSQLSVARERELATALERRMAAVSARGTRAATYAARLTGRSPRVLFRDLEDLRERTGVEALAMFDSTGQPIAWAGEHRGPLPRSLRGRGSVPYFEERPLFSYLYFPQPAGARGDYAVAAVLVETGFVTDAGETRFGDVIAGSTHSRATFRRGGNAESVWSLVAAGDTIVHARLDAMTQAQWRGNLDRAARRVTLIAVLSAYFLLSLAWLRWTVPTRSRRAAALPLLLAVPLIAGLPLRGAIGSELIFSPTLFILSLPVRGDVSLGRLLALLLPVAALVAGLRRKPLRPARSLGWMIAGALAIALAYPLVTTILLRASTQTLLQGHELYWIVFQLALVITLACITVLAMPRAAASARGRWRSMPGLSRLLYTVGISVSVALAIATALPILPGQTLRVWLTALWAIPFVILAIATAHSAGRSGTLLRWLTAGWLAGTAVLPQLWSAHLQAQLAAGEGDLSTLGSDADTFLDYLLSTFGREALERFAAGEEGVLLLYRTWVASRLAEEPYPARIVLWTPEGIPEQQLGSAPTPSDTVMPRLLEVVAAAREQNAPFLVPFTDLPNHSRMVIVPLADGSLITVLVPPRRTLERTSSIAPFLGVVELTRTRLHLVEKVGAVPTTEEIDWIPEDEGWRSEKWVKYPDGWYHAHLLVSVPSAGVRYARATLLLTLNLVVFTLIWVIGVVARGGTAVPRGDWTGWLGSFRARITLALFGFFLIPTALFGWVAYSALAGEVARAAETIAQHSADQAVAEFEDAGGNLRELADHAGTDVLFYQGGELLEPSSREALELGIYSAWMPPDVYQRLVLTSEARSATHTQRLGNRDFVTAYSALRAAGVLGVPLSLSAGDAPSRQRELAHLVLFAAVIGALLSLVLSVAVGRALAGPIGQLRWAATVVGAGKLRVRLPESRSDEFGELFGAFNRMTRRLRRARTREIRSARVLAWGEMARQVAHEIKNPLTPIKLSVQHLRRAYADRHPQFEDILDSNVTQILSEIDRLSEIARAFSRYGAPAEAAGPLASVDAPQVVRETLTLYRSGDRGVNYIDTVTAALPRVQARPNELKEVLINLVENSRAALDGAGEIVISARSVDDRVEIVVSDNGRGIPPELLPRIFDPHFSTRSVGTGLGLAIVRRIVESWGGTVTADSEVGRGTTVTMRLLPA